MNTKGIIEVTVGCRLRKKHCRMSGDGSGEMLVARGGRVVEMAARGAQPQCERRRPVDERIRRGIQVGGARSG